MWIRKTSDDSHTMDALEIEKVAADWLARRTNGSWSSVDQQGFEAWFNADLAHRIAYIRLESVWNRAERLQVLAVGKADVEIPPSGTWSRGRFATHAFARSDSTPGVSQSPAQPRRWLRFGGLAAGLLLALGAGLYPFREFLFSTHRYVTQIGAIHQVSLDDGSHVTLNTDSRIRVDITQAERRIELDRGEAFFDVAKDARRPFVVKVGNRRVVAVGTAFSVRRVGDDIRVAVTDGKVRLENGRGPSSDDAAGQDVLLSAGSVAQTQNVEVALHEHARPQVEQILSWRHGYLVFRDTALADAVAEFNRYNTRKIVIADPAIAAIRIGGNFRSNTTDTFLWMLQNGFNVNAEVRENEVILKAR
jgi:transmembrane sensor